MIGFTSRSLRRRSHRRCTLASGTSPPAHLKTHRCRAGRASQRVCTRALAVRIDGITVYEPGALARCGYSVTAISSGRAPSSSSLRPLRLPAADRRRRPAANSFDAQKLLGELATCGSGMPQAASTGHERHSFFDMEAMPSLLSAEHDAEGRCTIIAQDVTSRAVRARGRGGLLGRGAHPARTTAAILTQSARPRRGCGRRRPGHSGSASSPPRHRPSPSRAEGGRAGRSGQPLRQEPARRRSALFTGGNRSFTAARSRAGRGRLPSGAAGT